MVKKTLLSMAIAATVVGLAGCNVSSTDKYDNKITDNAPSSADMQDVGSLYPIFAPERGELPLATDLVFAKAADTDGTADTEDTDPPVTTALNKLAGFSTIAPIYINFEGEPASASVAAGQTVFLIKLKTGQGIDALDLKSIMAGTQGEPVAGEQPKAGDDYTADVVKLGDTSAVRILLKKPLDPKTKYVVALTDGITDGTNNATGSSTYQITASNNVLPSKALAPVREAVQGWEQIAGGYIEQYSTTIKNNINPDYPLIAQDNIVLSYAFTTDGIEDVLHAMAAPSTFILKQVPTVEAAEGAIIQGAIEGLLEENEIAKDATAAEKAPYVAAATTGANEKLDGLAAMVIAATAPSLEGIEDRATLKVSPLKDYYHKALIENVIAPSKKIDLEALEEAADAPKSRTYQAIMQDATTPVAVPYTHFLTAQITSKVTKEVTKAVEANREAIAASVKSAVLGANPEATEEQIATAVEAKIDNQISSRVAAQNISNLVNAATSDGAIYQGGLKIPNYLPEAEAGKADNELGSWVANESAAVALGEDGAPRDVDGSTNVTYRLPFAEKLSDNVIPVFATLPSTDTSKCGPKPDDGWPVAIYQHGITADRTAGALVGNALAKACVAMVAIDHTMHGVAPKTATGVTFSVDLSAETSPFGMARAVAEAQGIDLFASLKERHNNVGKNKAQANVKMEFASAGAETDVGESGDLYINLKDFARTRDAMRQTVLDLLNLNASIAKMDVDGKENGPDLDGKNVYFIGHSLGSIIGTTFVAVNNHPEVQFYNSNLPEIKAAILANGGGGVVKLLENSPGIGAAKILPGLKAAAGLEQGSDSMEKFFGIMQAMVDSVDPINFASAPHMQSLPILSYTAVGDVVVPNDTLSPIKFELKKVGDDIVPVPVIVDGSPVPVPTAKSYLSGTDPLEKALGISKVVNGSTDKGPVMDTRISIRTDAEKSDHSTFSSADPQETFEEIFGQIGSFLAEKAEVSDDVIDNPLKLKGIKVTDPTVLEQVE